MGRRGLIAAGAVLVLGGLVLGGLPLPLAGFGCGAAFGVEVLDGSIDVLAACAAIRADRQNLALALMLIGVALAVGATVHDRRVVTRPDVRAETRADGGASG